MDEHEIPEAEIPSAVAQVAALKPGDTYTRSTFIPAYRMSRETVNRAKRAMMSAMTPVISRARNRRPGSEYRLSGIHALTADYDMIVAVVVVCAEDGDQL